METQRMESARCTIGQEYVEASLGEDQVEDGNVHHRLCGAGSGA